MKAVMYHYVRPPTDGLPFFRYLDLDDFRAQLDHFAATEGFLPRAEFLNAVETGEAPGKGIVLTFDDGFSDHSRHVLPVLRDRGLWGLFYVSTGVYRTRKLLDVHRIHMLLGTYGGAAMLESLRSIVTDAMLPDAHVAAFHDRPYRLQDNDASTDLFKRTLNYYISYEWREAVLDRLMARHLPDEAAIVRDFYMSEAEVRAMQDAGMLIGSHSVTHRVFSKLPVAEQEREIAESFADLDGIAGGLAVRSFCYPYGGFHSFTADTERLLTEQGCRFAFNVEPREIASGDLTGRPQALPRFDCNLFPHGASRLPERTAN